MDPITIAQTAIKVGMYLFDEAKKHGIIGQPDWANYVDAGMSVLLNGSDIVAKIKSGSTDYDHLTAAEIEALLMPDEWVANEIRRLADEKAAKEANGG